MTIQEVIKKIDRYLKKDNVEPLIVDVQNKVDLDAIMLLSLIHISKRKITDK